MPFSWELACHASRAAMKSLTARRTALCADSRQASANIDLKKQAHRAPSAPVPNLCSSPPRPQCLTIELSTAHALNAAEPSTVMLLC